MAQNVDITADLLVSVSAGINDMHEEVRSQLRTMIHYMLGYRRGKELFERGDLSVLFDERGGIRDIDLIQTYSPPMIGGVPARDGTWCMVPFPSIPRSQFEALTQPKSYIDENGKRRFPKGMQAHDAILALAESHIVGNEATVNEIVRCWRIAAPEIINGLYDGQKKVSKVA
ncbi:hypothetical protein [Azospirillum brasilense]|uniref:hypothetical protein n=1 Tax=Azospirillum brasilense TaxID=192 RepID=UPI000E67CE87|nr:hypothetical protein [Azospirillum brasilense]NUB23328.1 hypothetical protein [Azospirillum brasilense]NUB30950.1 hypothetical protein [Azospirillum brasilense]RIW05667.1 hypothetical protein D2T81_07425 [Azospirillum brasilense]